MSNMEDISIYQIYICEEQAGFRLNRARRDQITNIQIIEEQAKERNQFLHFRFVDFTETFDLICHNQMWLMI